MEVKLYYERPSVIVTQIEAVDVITTSGAVSDDNPDISEKGSGENDLPWDK